ALLYQRGAFTAETTAMTAAALSAFAVGLPAYVMIKVFQPAYFARLDMRTPMWFSIATVVLNVVLSLALFPVLGHVGIALATSLSAWLNTVMLAGVLWRRSDFRPSPATFGRLGWIAAASIAMGASVLALGQLLEAQLTGASLLPRAAATL